MIGGKPAMISQEHISHEHNTRMADKRIVVTALNLLGQAQVLFDHFEKHLDVPAFPVGADDVLSAQIDICGKQCQPVAFASVSHEYQLARQPAAKSHRLYQKTGPFNYFLSYFNMFFCFPKAPGESRKLSELLGHRNPNITTGRYGKRFDPKTLLERAVIKLDYYGIDLSHLKSSKWVPKRD
jgi:hypothetical protein